MKIITIDADWLIKRAEEEKAVIDREEKMGNNKSEFLSTIALGKIKMIEEIFNNKQE